MKYMKKSYLTMNGLLRQAREEIN